MSDTISIGEEYSYEHDGERIIFNLTACDENDSAQAETLAMCTKFSCYHSDIREMNLNIISQL